MKKTKVLGIIPARLGSTRLPRKMLLEIGGKPLIYYTWRQAKKSRLLDEVIVAVDSRKIYDAVTSFGGKAIMTPANVRTGSDRVAAALMRFREFKPDIVLNIQGDEPLMPISAIDMTAKLLKENSDAVMSTVATPLTLKKELENPGIVKVVLDKNSNALYFSRSIIPHPRTSYRKYLKHLGLYGFRTNFLLRVYTKLAETPLEMAESLEQLRVLENGYKIKVGIGKFERVEVNTKEEFLKVRALIESKL